MKLKNLVLAIAVAIASLGAFSHEAMADDWPCEAIMCLSNPGGATQFSQCVPPMNQFWTCMANVSCAFPGCNEGGVSANMSYESAELCPVGTSELQGKGGLINCAFQAKQGNIYYIAPVANPYRVAFKVAWSGGGETMYLDTGNQTESFTDPQPTLSAKQIAYWDAQPREK